MFNYADFADVFSLNLVVELPKYNRINNFTIQMINGKQPFYDPIYSLELVEMETLKIYIKTNLANDFIKPFKFLVSTPILFVQRPDSSFWIYVNSQGLNN